jgi:hypothetical protein
VARGHLQLWVLVLLMRSEESRHVPVRWNGRRIYRNITENIMERNVQGPAKSVAIGTVGLTQHRCNR